jgi:hypothetical protein
VRNVRVHGIPLGSGYQSGLIEAVRDLIEYAYRDWIEKAETLGWNAANGGGVPPKG